MRTEAMSKLTRQANGNYTTDDGRFEVMRLKRNSYRLQDHRPGRVVPFGWSTRKYAFSRTLRGARQKIRAAVHQVDASERDRLMGKV